MDRAVYSVLSAMTSFAEKQMRNAEVAGDNRRTRLSVSVIIPTKNRATDLARTIDTLMQQSVQPLELILVDQSATPTVTQQLPFSLVYIHDPTLSGASVARNIAMDKARGDIWLFLDDDVLLERDFIEQILAAYDSSTTGVSGIITNYLSPPLKQRLWEAVFQIGPFRDERQGIYRNAERLRGAKPIQVSQFGAGLMSFRASAIRNHRFDPNLTGASPGEDIDFCRSLPQGRVLLITPKARLIHNKSPESRDPTHWISVAAQVTAYMRVRHWSRGWWNNLCYAWLSAGYAAAVSFSSLKGRTSTPWKAWRAGIKRGKQISRGLN